MSSLYDSNLSRRSLIKYLGLLGATTLVGLDAISCNGSKKQAGIREVNFWGTGTLDIGDKWKKVESEKGIHVAFEDNRNDPGPVITKLVRDREFLTRHVSGMQGGAERELVTSGAIIPWDLKLIPNYEKLWDWAKTISYTVVNGKHFGIPSVINADSMIYLPEFTGEITSYSSVFDPAFRGKTSMEDAWINSVIFAAIYLKESHLQKIQDPGNLTETELREVMRFLSDKARQGQFRKLWSGWTDGVQLIESKEVWVMTGWEPIVLEAQRRGVKAKYAVPREGYEGWSNDLLLHPGAKAAGLYEAAHELVNWELSGYYGCVLAETRGYIVPTDEGVHYAELHPEEFSPIKIKEMTENVKGKFFAMKGQVYWQNVRPNNFQLYEEEWSKFRSLF